MNLAEGAILACTVCSTAIADSVLPPIGLWAAIGAAWFLLTATLASLRRGTVPGHPRLRVAVRWVTFVGVLAVGGSGPGLGLLLFVPPAGAFVVSVCGARTRFADPVLRRYVQSLGAIALVVIGAAGVYALHIHRTRTAGEFIVQWDGAGITRDYLRRLKSKEPDSLDDYRYVVTRSRLLAGEAALRIAELGDASDLAMLESIAESGEVRYDEEKLQTAIVTLRGRLEAHGLADPVP